MALHRKYLCNIFFILFLNSVQEISCLPQNADKPLYYHTLAPNSFASKADRRPTRRRFLALFGLAGGAALVKGNLGCVTRPANFLGLNPFSKIPSNSVPSDEKKIQKSRGLYEPGTPLYVRHYSLKVLEKWQKDGLGQLPPKNELDKLGTWKKVETIFRWIRTYHVYPKGETLEYLGELESSDVLDDHLMHCYRSAEELLGLLLNYGAGNTVILIPVTHNANREPVDHAAAAYLDIADGKITGIRVLDATLVNCPDDKICEPTYARIGVYLKSGDGKGRLNYMSMNAFREGVAKGKYTLSNLVPAEANAAALKFMNVARQKKTYDELMDAMYDGINAMNNLNTTFDPNALALAVEKCLVYLSDFAEYVQGDLKKSLMVLMNIRSLCLNLVSFHYAWFLNEAGNRYHVDLGASKLEAGKELAEKIPAYGVLSSSDLEKLKNFGDSYKFYKQLLAGGKNSILQMRADAAAEKKDFKKAKLLFEHALSELIDIPKKGPLPPDEIGVFNILYNDLVRGQIISWSLTINPDLPDAGRTEISRIEEYYESLKSRSSPFDLSSESGQHIEALIGYQKALHTFNQMNAAVRNRDEPDFQQVLNVVRMARRKCSEVEMRRTGVMTPEIKQLKEMEETIQKYIMPSPPSSFRYDHSRAIAA
jgi:hypothetical protein